MTTESDLDLITVHMFDVKPEAAGYSSRNTVCVSVVTPSRLKRQKKRAGVIIAESAGARRTPVLAE